MSWQPTLLEEQRIAKLDQLREVGIDPYPIHSARSHVIAAATNEFLRQEAVDDPQEVCVTVCGRLYSVRNMGKTIFAHIEDESGRLQLFLRRDEIGQESHQIFRKMLDLGDFVQATGSMFRTRMGEVSLRVREWQLLSKAISPLPVAKEQEVDGEVVRYSAFSDVEERYRQRYADLAVNSRVRDIFRARARLINALRSFFTDNDF